VEMLRGQFSLSVDLGDRTRLADHGFRFIEITNPEDYS
jgi:hypothetical protein